MLGTAFSAYLTVLSLSMVGGLRVVLSQNDSGHESSVTRLVFLHLFSEPWHWPIFFFSPQNSLFAPKPHAKIDRANLPSSY